MICPYLAVVGEMDVSVSRSVEGALESACEVNALRRVEKFETASLTLLSSRECS
jgi:hypothetical protein